MSKERLISFNHVLSIAEPTLGCPVAFLPVCSSVYSDCQSHHLSPQTWACSKEEVGRTHIDVGHGEVVSPVS